MNKFIDWMCDKTNMLIESTMSGVSNWTFYDTDKVPTKNENLKIVIDFFNDYLKNVIEQYRINPKYIVFHFIIKYYNLRRVQEPTGFGQQIHWCWCFL